MEISNTVSAKHSAFRFSHQAMATVHEIFIRHNDQRYARQASQEAFFLLDRLEHDLSRFIGNSDISSIDHLTQNEKRRIGPDTFACLKRCAELCEQTNGAFDITVGSLMELWLDENKNLRHPSAQAIAAAKQLIGFHHLQLNEADCSVTRIGNPVKLDLGGFGKGYAVDRMAEILTEWEIEDFLIHGGQSSVLARGDSEETEGWLVSISDPFKQNQFIENIMLKNQAMSGSGMQKGYHLIDPRTARPVEKAGAAWVIGDNAAICDALSTAFLIMSHHEVESYCATHPEIKVMLLFQNQKMLKFG